MAKGKQVIHTRYNKSNDACTEKGQAHHKEQDKELK